MFYLSFVGSDEDALQDAIRLLESVGVFAPMKHAPVVDDQRASRNPAYDPGLNASKRRLKGCCRGLCIRRGRIHASAVEPKNLFGA